MVKAVFLWHNQMEMKQFCCFLSLFANLYLITSSKKPGLEFRNLPPKNSKRVDLVDEWLEEQSKSKDRKLGSSQCSDKVV